MRYQEIPPVRGRQLSKPNLIKEARQKQLIEATISSIGRHGYAGTTLNHVAGAAGLSPGIVNFYFKSKDQLLAATLAKLAEEYELFWMAAIEASRQSPAAGLEAMLEADFHPTICTHEKVVVWFAFWSEAQSRPLYKSVVSELEERYHFQTVALFAALIEEGGYTDIDADSAAHRHQCHGRRPLGGFSDCTRDFRPGGGEARLPPVPGGLVPAAFRREWRLRRQRDRVCRRNAAGGFRPSPDHPCGPAAPFDTCRRADIG